MCKHTLSDLHDRFRFFDSDEINVAVRELISEKLVTLAKSGQITIGTTSKGIHSLLGVKVDSFLEKYKKQLNDLAESFKESAGGINVILARDNMVDLDCLMTVPFSEWTTTEFEKLYKISYVSAYQQTHRPFSGKERGQLKALQSYYQTSVLFKMVVHYVLNSEKYHRKDISLGLFLYNKDKIHAVVTEQNKDKVKMSKLRTKLKSDDEETFG